MKFSIIIPVYNEERYIAQCIKSLLSLRYQDKEIIVVNDGSTDSSQQVLDNFLKEDITLINLERHMGISYALRRGLSVSTGSIIVRTDADTVVDPNWLDLFKNYFLDENVVGVGGSYECLNNVSIVALCANAIDRVFISLLKRKLLFNRLPGANRAMRKDALLMAGGFDKRSDLSEDTSVYIRLKNIGRIIFDPKIAVKTRYPADFKQLWKRSYIHGRGIAVYLKNFKACLRPIFILGFYFTFGVALSEFFILHKIGLMSSVFMLFYLGLLLLLSITSLFLLPKRKIIFLFVPVVFIIQNTAYVLGAIKEASVLKSCYDRF